MVTSTNIPELVTASDCQERLPESLENRGCETVISPVSNSEAASIELPLNVVDDASLIRYGNDGTRLVADAILNQEFSGGFAFRFPVPASTLDMHGSSISDQGAQGTGFTPISSVLVENITTAAEHWTPRSTSLGGASAQPPNISYRGPTFNTSADMSLPNSSLGQSRQLHFPSYIDVHDYELEKLNREQGNVQKHFEQTRSELMAELGRKMAEVRSEYDMKSQEVDAAYNTQVKEEEANRSLVVMNSLLANSYKKMLPVKSAATNTAAVRATNSQHSTQQQQVVQTNPHMSPTVPLPVTSVEGPISSGPLLHFQHLNTPQPRSISPQAAVQAHQHTILTTLPRPSVTAEAHISHSPRCNTPQQRPISHLPAVQSNTHIRSTALPRPLVTSEAISLHSPPSNMPQPRPPPLISNHSPSAAYAPVHGILRRTMAPRPPPLISNNTPSSYSAASAPPGIVRRAMPPHLRSSRAPNSAAATTTNQTGVVQEQQQQHQQQQQIENSNGSFVDLSGDE